MESTVCGKGRAPRIKVPGLQEGEQSLLEDVENCGEEEGERQEDEQFVGELSAVVLGDQFSPELDGPCHGLELVIGLLDCPWGGCFKTGEKTVFNTSLTNLRGQFNYQSYLKYKKDYQEFCSDTLPLFMSCFPH